MVVCAAVQEERQRGKERGENEVESTSSFNEEMPVDKILDAELAVEPKTETYSDGSPSNSVRTTDTEPKPLTINHWFDLEAELAHNRWRNRCILKMCCSVMLACLADEEMICTPLRKEALCVLNLNSGPAQVKSMSRTNPG